VCFAPKATECCVAANWRDGPLPDIRLIQRLLKFVLDSRRTFQQLLKYEKAGCSCRLVSALSGKPAGCLPPAGAGRSRWHAAGEVAASLGIAPNALTFHLDRLREASLATVRRDGRSMIYAAQYETMNALLGYLTENCCSGTEQCAPAAACKPARAKTTKIPA
jgi:ArsR family transcriptional regulator, arsenate/arsenite/antimonite-responsive transcriptional repressor